MRHPVLHLLLAALLASAVPLQAGATSWTEAIDAVEKRSEELWQLAHQRGLEGRHIGTAYNELHANEHSCAILGRMLKKTDLIVALEKETEIDVSATDGQDTGVAAHSLSNWAHNAKRLVAADESRRIREWNLDCVGAFGIPGSAWIGEKTTSAFFDVEGTTVRVLGNVEQGFSRQLREVLDQNPDVRYVALGSGGGSVHEAILAGIDIRTRRLNTTLWNNCYSACTIVFVGGVTRTIWSPFPDLGFHQVSLAGTAVPFDDRVYERLVGYASVMDIHVPTFMELIWSAAPSTFTIPDSATLCAANIATWVQRSCDAEDYGWKN